MKDTPQIMIIVAKTKEDLVSCNVEIELIKFVTMHLYMTWLEEYKKQHDKFEKNYHLTPKIKGAKVIHSHFEHSDSADYLHCLEHIII